MFRTIHRTMQVALAAICCVVLLKPGPIRAQKIGPEFRVNTHTGGDQALPAVSMNASGSFVVAWESSGQDGEGLGVFAQRFDALGNKIGGEFQANTHTALDQSFAAPAMRNDGTFLIAWQSTGQDGDGRGVFARLFDADGVPAGPEFQVNTTTYSNQAFPHVAINPNTGGFVITWSSAFQDGSHDAVIVRLYDANCLPVSGEIQANTYTFAFQGYSRVGCDATGNFTIVWTSYEQDGDGYTVAGQRFRNTGIPIGNEFLVNIYTVSHQDYPDVAVSGDGSNVVVWHSAFQDGSSYGVYGRRYNSSGQPIGGEFQINGYTTRNQWWPKIAMDGYGSYTVVWQSDLQDGNARGVVARRYRADHTTHSDEFVVNTHTADDQDRPAIASDPSGNLVVVWESDNQDGSGLGIYGQRIETGTVPCAFASVTAVEENGAARIRWQIAPGSPVAGYNVYRTTDREQVQIAAMLPPQVCEFLYDGIQGGRSYAFQIGLVDGEGRETLSPSVILEVAVHALQLYPNRPNPFHPETTIDYELAEEGKIDIRVYDTAGRFVVSLESGRKPAGRHSVIWDGRNALGLPVSTGVYYYQLKTGRNVLTKKMLLIR
jgi:hypothetical protein